MKICEYKGFYFILSELFLSNNIKHMFTTIKDTERNSENNVSFSYRFPYTKEEVSDSYKKVSEYFEVPYENITKSAQVHKDNILKIEERHIGMGVTKETDFTDADGIYTDKKDVPLCVFTADCVPVILADKNKKVVLNIHSGWRGTALKIVKKAVDIMKKEYKVDKEDIICAIGPAISKCCFEVSKDVIDAMAHIDGINECYNEEKDGKFKLDLKEVNKRILINSGVSPENIDVCDLCTKCEDTLFHSYRRQGELSGRNAAFISL